MNRVLVTGATGFIGQSTLAPLQAAGFDVHAVSSKPVDATSTVHWHQVDLLDGTAREQLVATLAPSHLLHLAWYAEPGAFWSSTENLRWVEASLALLRSFTAAGGERAVFAGTCAEYEWTDHTVCHEATTPCRPATLYGTCKNSLREIAEAYTELTGVSFAWGRIFFVFGPHEHPARLGGSVARALVNGEPALCSAGTQIRDFLYSEDVAEAFVALLSAPVTGAVNIASGRPLAIREFVEALAAPTGRSDLVQFGARPTSASEPAEILADISRLRDEVGWQPTRTLQQRAVDTIAWWRSAV